VRAFESWPIGHVTGDDVSGRITTTDATTTDATTTDATTTDATSGTTGPGPVCGDGNTDVDEECDDGNQEDADACTNACKNAACGDGIVGPGEMCDDGNQEDADECTNACAPASCGDSIVNAGVEECDDGNMVDTDACTNLCKTAVCGDGVVQAGVEECDDGNVVGMDGCSAMCKTEAKIIFVSSQMYNGNMGGLLGADAKCQALAVAANLPGTYMAWLSDNTGSPSTRMVKSAVPYVRPNGTKIANNWADLTDGNLLANLDMNENMGTTPLGNTSCAGGGFKTVWSNTTPSGTLGNANSSCSNWGSTNGGSAWGRSDQTTNIWTQWCSGGLCSWVSPIYCVQQ